MVRFEMVTLTEKEITMGKKCMVREFMREAFRKLGDTILTVLGWVGIITICAVGLFVLFFILGYFGVAFGMETSICTHIYSMCIDTGVLIFIILVIVAEIFYLLYLLTKKIVSGIRSSYEEAKWICDRENDE